MDWKKISLVAKDLLVGVGTVAAGVTAGEAGAQGVQQVDRGLDGVLGMTGVVEEQTPKANPRLHPERADFRVRQQANSPLPEAKTELPPVPRDPVFREAVVDPPEPKLAKGETSPAPTAEAQPVAKESPKGTPAHVAAELAQLGYSESEVAAIAEGRWQPSEKGRSVASAEGTRAAATTGQARKSAEVDAGGDYQGFRLDGVLGILKQVAGKKLT